MDKIETLAFLWGYPNADKLLYQFYDDVGKDPKKATPWDRLTGDVLDMLDKKNKDNCSICFSVNGFDTPARKKDNVKYINAWICEIDDVDKAFQKQLIELCPLKPSIVIESKNGYHMYWLAKDWTIENREKICNWLRNFFDWDPQAITIERILRLPWFYHCKNPDDKFMIRVVDITEEETGLPKQYTEAELLKYYPNTKTVSEKKKELKEIEKKMKLDDWDFWYRVSQFDCEKMLGLLSGTRYVNGENITFEDNNNNTKQIFVEGRSTACWLDSNWFIGSKSGWWPTWIQWITRYWNSVDRKELYKFLIDKFPELKKQKDKNKTPKQKSLESFFVEYDRGFEIDISNPIPFTWWLPLLDSEFWRIEKGRFMTTIGESWSGKTTRAFFQGIQLSKEYKVLFISLEMQGERVIELRARKMAGVTLDEWNTKNIPKTKLDAMKRNQKEITENKNLEIVGINKHAESVDVDIIISAIERKYMEFDFIIIDNLGFIQGEGDNFYAELNSIVRKFKNFCHDNGKNINLLHHFNKGKWDRRSRTFADVLGTGKLEHDIDYGLFVSRCLEPDEFSTEKDKAEVVLKMAKNRDTWVVKKVVIYFDRWYYKETFRTFTN